jgi:AraC family transcriptional regulator of adaptative response / DNA-3-methyladenine glycosylase II
MGRAGCRQDGRVVALSLTDEACYRAVRSRDARFDGWFVTAVTTTRIYCRPSCPALTPRRANVRFLPTAAAAQRAGFRACKRCRPDASPGSPAWNGRADVVARAMRLVADGVVDREGVGGLARRLHYSGRHLNRLLLAEVGAGPLALARAQRAQAARVLIETTTLPFGQVAFGAGFASVRQFNDTVREVFASSPSELRAAARRRDHAAPGDGPGPSGSLLLRLPFRPPLDRGALLRFLGHRAVPGVETFDGTTFARALDLPHGPATVELTPLDDHVACRVRVADWRDVGVAVARSRRLLDLDADPVAVDEVLGADPLLAPLVTGAPGRRSPGFADGAEGVVRAVLGQQVSVAGARSVAARLAAAHGTPLPDRADRPHGLTTVFPRPDVLAAIDPATLPMPRARARSLVAACRALADGALSVDVGADADELRARLAAQPGIGPWTAGYVVMRALGHPDVLLPTDLGVRRSLAALGVDARPATVVARAERWRPWRSYAVHHLWDTRPATLQEQRRSA